MLRGRLKILAQVVKRRVQAGEDRDTVLGGYLLTEKEKVAIIAALDEEAT